jgi:hypothetical protein
MNKEEEQLTEIFCACASIAIRSNISLYRFLELAGCVYKSAPPRLKPWPYQQGKPENN